MVCTLYSEVSNLTTYIQTLEITIKTICDQLYSSNQHNNEYNSEFCSFLTENKKRHQDYKLNFATSNNIITARCKKKKLKVDLNPTKDDNQDSNDDQHKHLQQ